MTERTTCHGSQRPTPAPSPRWTLTSVAAAIGGGVLVGLNLYGTSLDELDRASHIRQSTAAIVEPAERSQTARGHWTAPDGTARSGTIPDAEGHPAGARVSVWTDKTGTLTQRPRSHTAIVWQASAVGSAVTIVIILLTERTRRALLRTGAIDTEWQHLSPIWRRRHL